ncbi:hypothetical protein JH06_5091 [Blastocystis sp. subtype 4]|uniref:hypothetical protein n=1 Tax=Blastocystis sp. subtype 4 TaxID=944170 RepID=UPI000711C7C1|nr:hypothetical protein JH06_5091 [Blastocystis sp. subtype 4]KNB42606.1 hypothetical protein JH06_5091 [Blastocystis sp. subtype 4]|eukprot:XP_014526049.1 hypothetical protein JH06_5091 [Blastocystis sp. subtype 4]
MEGMKAVKLPGAVANLQQGSIDCVQCSDSEYLLVVTGKLAFKDILKDFTQVFVLSELRCTGKNTDTGVKKVVFYVRSEVLTIHGSEEEEVGETVKDPVTSEQSEAKTVERKETPAPAESRQEERRPRYASQASGHGDGETDERPKERRPIFAKNLVEDVNEEDIREAFSPFGEIYQVKIFPEKRYATVSFPKENGNYNVHEVFDRITKENPHFTIRGAAVRLEPFNCRCVVFCISRSES